MKTWASLLCDIPVHASFSNFNINMDIFHLIYYLPGKNCQAHPPKNFCTDIISHVFSGCSDILTLKRQKGKILAFCSTVIFLMVAIKAYTAARLQWQCVWMHFLSCSSCPAGLCGGSCSVRYLQSAVKWTRWISRRCHTKHLPFTLHSAPGLSRELPIKGIICRRDAQRK